MQLLAKFNLILVTVFAIGLLAICLVTDAMLKRSAQQEVVNNARLMTETALATRAYTAHQITPLLAVQTQGKFLPQSIPFYLPELPQHAQPGTQGFGRDLRGR